ncbi:protein SPA1-RELATED 4-like [Phalaenopsis equestris]|uniref:protein SPA1-RELATED 4-like n=1 Tax=Phalaenopsis equestris TaxID=78828 RepID=UPI0009E2CD81|nr:protein SPA1-RELATED 4-like [Phalaenopsis equestris]
MDDEAEEDDCLVKFYQGRSFDVGLKTFDHVDQNPSEVSLREWLDQPKRLVDLVECLHIFRQVVETVNIAHSLNVVLNNVRPSCFVMSSFYSVSFIESASCSSSASESSSGEEDSGRDGGTAGDKQVAAVTELASVEELEGKKGLDVVIEVGERRDFPLKKILNLEFNWYRSPEEVEGGKITFASDIYKLGVLLFELFCTFDTLEEKISKMANLKHRVLPPQMLFKWPKEASFCLQLLHPRPNSRPTTSELLQSELFNEIKDSVGELEAAIKLNEGIEEQELTLDFLQLLQRRKQEAADKLHDTFVMLSADIEEVAKQRSAIMKSGCSFLEQEKNHKPIHKFECPIPFYEMNEDSSLGSRKRIRQGHVGCVVENEEMHFGHRAEANQEIQDKALSKSCRIMKNLQNFEAAYFSSRCSSVNPVGKLNRSKLVAPNLGSRSTMKNVGNSVNYLASKEGICGRRMGQWINPFFEDLCKYLSFSQFKVLAELRQRDLLNSSNLICSLAFDRDKQFFATAGLNRKIKVFEFDAIINQDRDMHYPVIEMASRSKLSNVCWNGYIKNQIASSDFEGVVQVWDVTRSEVLLEMREHEKRVWSVNYSLVDPTKLASGSDDGTVKLWKINQGGSTGTIRTKANVCSVEFPPDTSGILANGFADHYILIYCYDLRNMSLPLRTFVGHSKTVSYVKFVDSSTLVSSSTDNSLKLWDLSVSTSRILDNPIRTFTGHTNVKNFVGLSISDGYIATGSETNEVFIYQKAFPMPVFSYKFGGIDLISGFEADDANQFVSCVCWRGQSSDLVATNSNGNIKVLEMV